MSNQILQVLETLKTDISDQITQQTHSAYQDAKNQLQALIDQNNNDTTLQTGKTNYILETLNQIYQALIKLLGAQKVFQHDVILAQINTASNLIKTIYSQNVESVLQNSRENSQQIETKVEYMNKQQISENPEKNQIALHFHSSQTQTIQMVNQLQTELKQQEKIQFNQQQQIDQLTFQIQQLQNIHASKPNVDTQSDQYITTLIQKLFKNNYFIESVKKLFTNNQLLQDNQQYHANLKQCKQIVDEQQNEIDALQTQIEQMIELVQNVKQQLNNSNEKQIDYNSAFNDQQFTQNLEQSIAAEVEKQKTAFQNQTYNINTQQSNLEVLDEEAFKNKYNENMQRSFQNWQHVSNPITKMFDNQFQYSTLAQLVKESQKQTFHKQQVQIQDNTSFTQQQQQFQSYLKQQNTSQCPKCLNKSRQNRD